MSTSENILLAHNMSVIRDREDQTKQAIVNSDGSIKVSDADANSSLTGIAEDIASIESKTPSLVSGDVPVVVSNLATLDAFGRQRVSQPETLFDMSHLYDKQPLYIEEILASGATTTHLPNEAAVRMSVTTTVGSRAVRQTKRYFNYQPGKSLLVLMTGILSESINTGVKSRIGFFDNHTDKSVDSGGNGIFFEYSEGSLKIVKRSYTTGSQVDTAVSPASWSEGDPLDGTGASGVTFDPTKTQIFWIDFEWLGVGTVRCGIVYNGQYLTLHKFHHANMETAVYMSRASLPIRYEVEQITGASAANMKMICCAVMSEGGYKDTGRVLSRPRTTTISVGATLLPIMAIRLKNGYNRSSLYPISADLMTTSNQSIIYQVLYGATLTGGSWIGHDTTYSGVEYNISATAVTGGRIVESGYLSTQGKQIHVGVDTFDVPNVSIAGVSEIVVLAAQATGTAATYGSLTWRETA